MAEIILTTLNARYSHASLGLRYLLANMRALESKTKLMEFTTEVWPIDIVEALLSEQPRIIGFGVYIWNVGPITQVVSLLKSVRSEVVIVLGGPEVSYEAACQPVAVLADYVISGPADLRFAELCQQILAGQPLVTTTEKTSEKRTEEKWISAPPPPLSQINFPYRYYTDEDIAHRTLYVEASRGCPFKCEFCLSALDKTAWPFQIDAFLDEIDQLYQRGARQFKFVDRTFNLKIDTSVAILEFFLTRMDDDMFLHFELIPDHLPQRLKEILVRLPARSLQFEIGIQTFNPDVQALISRTQNNLKTKENLEWLRQNTHAHIHADLIFGLPGEDLSSFAQGFNTLIALNPHEIQVGILKRLRGTPIGRHTATSDMRYNPDPPYNILCTDRIDFLTMQRMNRFARFWDLIANSGRFSSALPLLLGDQPFQRFLLLSDWIYATASQTHRIALGRLFELLYGGLTTALRIDEREVAAALQEDYCRAGLKGRPTFVGDLLADTGKGNIGNQLVPSRRRLRQTRHTRNNID